MLKRKSWTGYLFSGILFLIAGGIFLINKNSIAGIMFIVTGMMNIVLSITQYKGNNKSNQIEVSDTDLENMNVELRTLITKGKKIEAIKKYRMVTGLGLLQAKGYVDSLSEKINT